MHSTKETGQGIAIIGMAGRFPGANSVAGLWEKVCEGADCLHYSTDEELKAAGVADWQIKHPEFVRVSGYLEDAAKFDAQFFGFSAHDAAMIDPQHRVFLECAWQAFEDAGYDPAEYGSGVAVFAGGSMNGYRRQDLGPELDTATLLGVIVGTERDFLATRVAYKLNLTGPAATVQTACSTSLVAVQMACESILNGNATMAIAGGVSITFPQGSGYIYQPGMILSPDGQCRAFDIKAAGTTMGRGAGAVLLKPLAAAVRDRDQIYAVIRGIAINNDGANKGGYTAPGVKGQSDVIRRSMKMAGFAPSTVKYVEAHGTGTEVGDAIEIAALTEAFSDGEVAQGACTVSSLKPNIGHLDAAAGVANLIKASMALRHRVLPGVRHYETPNPELNLATSPFRISSTASRYTDSAPFRAGVSSFGIGGTNVHVSLEEWQGRPAEDTASTVNGNGHRPRGLPQVFPLSANSEAALEAQRLRLADHLEAHPEQSLEDVAFTLQKGRRLFAHRYFATASDREELIKELRQPARLKTQSHVTSTKDPDVFFLFPGQGAQYVNMGRGLYETDTVFRETVDQCCGILEAILKFDLRTLLFPEPGHEDEATARLREASITAPALVVLEYALAKRLLVAGVKPKALLGHSLGQYLAATVSGVFQLEDLLLLAAERGRLTQSMPNGSMLAVSMSEEDVLKLLPSELSIAAINAPKQIIVSGPTDVIQAFAASLAKQKVACGQLPTSHAFHSAMLDPIAVKAAELVRKFKISKPQIPFLSNLSGTWITDAEATSPEYWAAHQRYAVRFADNLRALTAKGSGVLIEVGPGETLIGLAKTAARNSEDIRLISTTRRAVSQASDWEHWLQMTGQLWLAGVKINWDSIHGDRRPHRTSLPTYPFEREHYWIDDEFGRPSPTNSKPTGPLHKRDDVTQWTYARSWRSVPPLPLVHEVDGDKGGTPRHWIIISDSENKLLARVGDTLRAVDVVTTVHYGETFEKKSDSSYTFDPENAQHYLQLLAALREEELWPDHLMYMARKDMPGRPLWNSYQQLFYLGQALQQAGSFDGMTLHVLTDQAFDVLDEGRCHAAQSSVASLADVLGVELRGLRRQVIDLDLDARSDAAFEQLATQVTGEVRSPGENELVAFRGRARWVPAWEFLPLVPAESGRKKLRHGGTYLLTGGAGGIGLVLAEHLAKTAGAHLVLVGRSSFPAQTEWEALARDEKTDPAMRQKMQWLLRIRESGGTVEVLQGDVTDRGRMEELVAHARTTGRGLAGIIHAAGVVDYTVIGITEDAEVPRIFAAKAEGTGWIVDALAGGGLDFVMLCSSISAVTPSVGLCTYAAANAYLDGFAALHDDRDGTRVLSVNWDNWSEIGMAVDAAAMSKMKSEGAQEVRLGISNEEGGQVFDLLMNAPVSQVAVSTRDLPRLIEKARASAKAEPSTVDQLQTSGGNVPHARPELSREYTAPETAVQQGITDILQELLALERVGIHDDFFELGGHSLMGAQVIARIRERFSVSLPHRIIFDSPTAAAIASLVEARLEAAAETPQKPAERVEIEI